MDDLQYLSKEKLIAELEKTRQMLAILEQKNEIMAKELNYCRDRINTLLIAKERALKLAEVDYLTGLLNRRAFIKRLEGELNRSKRAGTSLSIIFADIDHFKEINDTYGHLVGDLVLRKFAKLLVKMCRNYDFLCRYGGEEFLICLPDTPSEQAYQIAQRISTALTDWYVKIPDSEKIIMVTSSFGVTTSAHDGKETVKKLLQKVDSALYKAKLNGRNRVEIC